MVEIVHVDGQAQNRVQGAVERALGCVVATEEDMGWASDDLATLRTIRKEFESKWDSLKEPLNEGLKRLKAEFEPYVSQLKAAEATVSGKILECKRKLQAEADKARRDREEADRKAREAAAKANMPPPPLKPVTVAETAPAKGFQVPTTNKKVTTTKVPKWRVVDANAIPMSCLVDGQESEDLFILNESYIGKLRRSYGDKPSPIPGIEFYYDETLGVR